MPNSAHVYLGVPYEAQFAFRGQHKRLEIDDHFEIAVSTLSKADTTLVARVGMTDQTIEYRQVDRRLFRPFTDLNRETWTIERLNEEPPPSVRVDNAWELSWGPKTKMLSSPWRGWDSKGEEVSEQMRARARRTSPRSWEEAGKRLQATAERGLCFVDGVLFQETRTPGWVFDDNFTRRIQPDMPDAIEAMSFAIIDPRAPQEELSAVAREMGFRTGNVGFDIRAPSLLPNTIEADSLASFSLWAYTRVQGLTIGSFDAELLADVLRLMTTVETSIVEGKPLNECYQLIERLASRREDGRGLSLSRRYAANVVERAVQFLDLRRRFPPPSPDLPDADVDDISQAFRP